MSDSGFAINLGEKYIQIADAEESGSQIQVRALAYDEAKVNIYVTEGEKPTQQVSDILSKLIGDAGIKKKGVHIIIPDSHSYSRIIEMPLLTEKELVSAIKYQADQFVPIPIEKVNLDIEILYTDKKNKKLSILIIAAPMTVVDKAVSTIETIGLFPESVENESSATLRLVSHIFSQQKDKAIPNQMTLFMNFGYSSTSLYLYENAVDLPRDIHNFPLGFDLFFRSIKANLNSNDDDIKRLLETVGFTNSESAHNIPDILSSPYNEMTAEVTKFIISAKSKFNCTIGDLYIFGEGFKIAGFCEKLSASLGIKVSLFNSYQYIPANNVVDFFKNDLPLFVPVLGGNLR